jgi:hypothetical protein
MKVSTTARTASIERWLWSQISCVRSHRQIPKRGTWRLPVLALFIFAVAALKSASGGTHRVRGVLVAVCVLSPVESTSPPC